jgi:hypothetical protein
LLAHGQWFSPASSTTKTGRHDIAKALLKVALSTINQIKTKSSLRKFKVATTTWLTVLSYSQMTTNIVITIRYFHHCDLSPGLQQE